MIYQHCMALAVSFMRHYIIDFMSSNSMHVHAVRNNAVARVTMNNQ